jgi:transcriptional regulator with XRE-family HTH domain
LTQMALAAKAGLHLNALGNLERGARTPSLHTILLLSRALDVRASDLVAKIDKFWWALH